MYESEYLNKLRKEVRAETLHKAILSLGSKRLGQAASCSQEAQLKRITDLARLERIHGRLLDAVSWKDLLSTP